MSEVREASNVVTSENSAEFYAQKLGLATEAEPEATTEAEEQSEVVEDAPVEVEAEAESESEPKVEEEAQVTDKKQNPKLEKRFSELTKQREMARQEAERERQRARELEEEIGKLRQATKPKAEPLEQEPQPAQFQDAFEYAKALAEWSTEKALRERDQQEYQRKVAEEESRVKQSWIQKQNAVKADIPDYDEKVADLQIEVAPEIHEAIMTSDAGPKVLYHLANNVEFTEKLAQMPVSKALREIGKLEAKFEDKAEEPVKTVATKSKAPAPINPLKAASSALDTPVGSDGQFHGTYAQWKEARKNGKIR